MSTPTREEKLQMILSLYEVAEAYASKAGMFLDRKCLEYRTSILADYAPLTEERVSELASRASLVSFVLNDKTRFGWDADFLERWLAEIDAELEVGR